MTKFKVGDRVEVTVPLGVAYANPERTWLGVQGTVLDAPRHQESSSFIQIGNLDIDYCRDDVNFFASSLKLVGKKKKSVPFKAIKERLKEAKASREDSVAELATVETQDEMLRLRLDIEFCEGLIVALEELLDAHKGDD